MRFFSGCIVFIKKTLIPLRKFKTEKNETRNHKSERG